MSAKYFSAVSDVLNTFIHSSLFRLKLSKWIFQAKFLPYTLAYKLLWLSLSSSARSAFCCTPVTDQMASRDRDPCFEVANSK